MLLILFDGILATHSRTFNLHLQFLDLLAFQGGWLKLKIQCVGDIADHICKLKHTDTLLKLLVKLAGFLDRLEIIFQGHIDLTFEKLVVCILVTYV